MAINFGEDMAINPYYYYFFLKEREISANCQASPA